MKQNSAILFHVMGKRLKNGYLGGLLLVLLTVSCPGKGYREFYDPDGGFGRADRGLSKIMLKIAGSIEHHGSPEPYLKWMLEEEHPRIAEKWKKATGKERGLRPEYLTDEYLKKMIAGWKGLEKPLNLQGLCRESGRYMRYAIEGSWNKSPDDWARDESNLSDAEKAQFKKFMVMKFFTKEDIRAMESFYADGGGHDKLSGQGKAQMSERHWLGKMPKAKRDAELARRKGGTNLVEFFNNFQERVAESLSQGGRPRVNSDLLEKELIAFLKLNEATVNFDKLEWTSRDAIQNAHLIKNGFDKRFAHVRKTASQKDFDVVEANLRLMVENIAVVAYSELEAAIFEMSADKILKDK